MNKIAIALAAVGLMAAGTARGELVFASSTQSTTIDFQSNVGFDGNPDTSTGDNVFKFSSGNARTQIERGASPWASNWNTAEWGFSTDAWSWWASNLDTGMGVGVPSQFGDFNNDGDLSDVGGGINAVSVQDRGTLGIGSSGDNAIRMGNANDGAWRDYSLTLRVINNSGGTISQWSTAVDSWHTSANNDVSTMSLSWSLDNSSFTTIDSYVGTNTGGTLTAAADPLSGTFSANVADGQYLYLKLAAIRSANSGSTIVFDNWNVTAIPEPGTLSVLLSAGGLILLRRRRRA